MPTANQRICGLAALAILAALFLGAFWWADRSAPPIHQPPEPHRQPAAAQEEKREQPKEPFWQRAVDDPVAAFTMALTVFTGILAFATFYLWKSTERLVVGAEDTAERQLRAYVLVDKCRIADLEVGKEPTARVEIKNFGQTPAYDLTQTCLIRIEGFPLEKEWILKEPADGEAAKSILGPQGVLITGSRYGALLSQMQIDALASGHYAMYVFGRIRYSDAFKQDRSTYYTLFSGGGVGVGSSVAPSHIGNRAD